MPSFMEQSDFASSFKKNAFNGPINNNNGSSIMGRKKTKHCTQFDPN